MAEAVGTVQIDVRANLDRLEQDLAKARSHLQHFDQGLSSNTATTTQLREVTDRLRISVEMLGKEVNSTVEAEKKNQQMMAQSTALHRDLQASIAAQVKASEQLSEASSQSAASAARASKSWFQWANDIADWIGHAKAAYSIIALLAPFLLEWQKPTLGAGIKAVGIAFEAMFPALAGAARIIGPLIVPALTTVANFAFKLTPIILGFNLLVYGIRGVNKELEELRSLGERSRDLGGISPQLIQGFQQGARGAVEVIKDMDAALAHAAKEVQPLFNPDWTVWDQGRTKLNEVERLMLEIREVFPAGKPFAALDLFRGTQDPTAKIMAVLKGMKELNDIGEKMLALQLGEKTFGKEFVENLRLGKVEFNKFLADVERAVVVGANVLPDELAKRAQDLDDRLRDAWFIIDRQLKPSFNSISAVILSIKEMWVDIVELVAKVTAMLPKTADEMEQIRKESFEYQQNLERANTINLQIARQRERMLAARERERSRVAGFRGGAPSVDEAGFIIGVGGAGIPMPRPRPPVATEKEADEIDKIVKSIERRIKVIEKETAAIGKSAGEQARFRTEALLSAQVLEKYTEGTKEYTDAMEKVSEASRRMGEAVQKNAEETLKERVEFERQTARMPEAHVQMLERLRAIYGKQVTPAIEQTTGAQIKYNQAVSETVQATRGFAQRAHGYKLEAETVDMAVGKATAYRAEQELLFRAQQKGIALGPTLRKEIADAATAMGNAAEAAERARIQSEIRRERGLLFLAPEEVQIANQLKSIYPDIATALASVEAAALRTNNALRQGFEFTHQVLSGITKDLMQGTKLVDALGKQVERLADMLIDMAARKTAAAIFGPIADMLAGAGGTETAGVTAGATTAATTLTAGGEAAGAAIVAAATTAAKILGFSGITTGEEVAAGGITGGAAVTTGGTAGGTATAAGGTAGGAALASGGIAAAVALYGPILIFVAAIAAAGTLFMRARQQEQERREREQRRVELGVQVNQFIGGLLGGAGEVQRRIEEAQERTIDLMREAAEIWDLATIARLQEALNEFIRREEEAFRRTFQFRLEALRAGFGPESGFARARSDVAQAADQIRNFVTDVGEILGSPTSHDVREAQAAGREFLLSMVGVAPEMSETQQELERIRGTASALQQALVDLGLSAEEAATAIEERTTQAIQALTERFSEDLVRDLREATGQGFLNEASDLIRDIERRRADAARLPGVDTSVIDRLFSARAQQIVDDARLMGEEFQALIRAFPELARVVHEFTDTVTRSAEETARAARDIEDEIFEAVVQTDTLEGQLATLERERRRRREEEVRAGGENLERLEVLFAIRRFNIIKEHNDRIVEETRRAEEERLDAIMRAAQTITDYLNQLNVTEMGGGTPLSRYTAAQAEFNRQLQLARGGDIEALEGITESAETFRRASQEMFGSTTRFQTDLATIRTTLGGLPGVPAPGEDATVAAINALAGPLGNIQTNTGTTSANTGTTSTNTLGALQQLLFMLNNTEDISAYTGDMVTSTEDISANTLASLTRLLTVMTNTGNTATNTDDISQYTGGMVTNTSGILDETGNTATNTSNTAVNTQRALQQLVSVLTRLGDILTELSATTTAVGETTTAIGESNTEGLRSLLVTLNSLTEPMRRNSVISAQMMGNLRIIADNTRIGIFPLGVAVTTLPMGGTEAGNVFTGFQRGGVLNPYQYGIMGEHHPAGPFIMRAGALPVPITPDMPLLGANDNSMVAGLLRRLLDEISGLRRDVVRANVAAAEHVREGINEVTDQQRQNRREASFNSKRNAA